MPRLRRPTARDIHDDLRSELAGVYRSAFFRVSNSRPGWVLGYIAWARYDADANRLTDRFGTSRVRRDKAGVIFDHAHHGLPCWDVARRHAERRARERDS